MIKGENVREIKKGKAAGIKYSLLMILFALIFTLPFIMFNNNQPNNIVDGGVSNVQEVADQEEEDRDIYKGGLFLLMKGSNYTINNGTYSGGNNLFGGCFYVGNGCTLTMNGGEISGCTAGYGGAIYVAAGGTAILNGGTIKDNYAQFGPAVYIEDGGMLINNGCTIEDNIIATYPAMTINYYVDGVLRSSALSVTGKFSIRRAPLKYTQCNGYFTDEEMTEPAEVGDTLTATEAQTVRPKINVSGTVNVYTRTATDPTYFTFNYNSGNGGYYTVKQNTSKKPSEVVVVPRQYNNGTNGIKDVKAIYNATSSSSGAFYNNNNITAVYMPNTITSIGSYAFYKSPVNATLQTVSIPRSVTSINQYAFYNCSGLTSIEIPDGVTTISQYTFYNCSGLESVTIGDNVTSIGNYAFSKCTGMKELAIGKGVTSLGTKAFYFCRGLEKIYYNAINVTSSLTENSKVFCLAGNLFGDNSNNENIFNSLNGLELIIGKNVTSIPSYLFYGNLDQSELIMISWHHFKNIVFEENGSLKSIGNYAFYHGFCNEYISLPNGLKTIGAGAFEAFGRMDGIIPDSVETIGDRAFKIDTVNATGTAFLNNSVTIGNSVTSIGEDAFYGCNLTYVTLGNSLSSVGLNAFAENDELTNINYTGNISSWCDIDFASPMSTASWSLYISNNLVSVANIQEPVAMIKGKNFSNCTSLTSITIPASVTSIADQAFYGCVNLTEINYNASISTDFTFSSNIFAKAGQNGDGITFNVGNNVSNIPAYLLYLSGTNAPNITSLHIGDGVNTIGAFAFYGCSEITSLTIPNNVTNIGVHAFSGCTSLTQINYNAINVTSTNNNIFANAGQNADGLTVDFGNSVINIPRNLFNSCSGLTEVHFGSNVTRIYYCAFQNCTGLTSITIPSSVTSIYDNAFDGCDELVEVCNLSNLEIKVGGITGGDVAYNACLVTTDPNELGGTIVQSNNVKYYVNTNVTSGMKVACAIIDDEVATLTLDNDCTEIRRHAFSNNTNITSVIIPSSMTSFGRYAFNGCSNLENVYYAGDIASWCTIIFGTWWVNTNWSLYINNSTISDLVIPNNVTNINDFAFYHCSGLTGILSIGNNVESIGSSAFEYCTGLTSVTIGDKVTNIGGSAFASCSELLNVTVGSRVTAIGNNAFYNCSKLETVIINISSFRQSDYSNSDLLSNAGVIYLVFSIDNIAIHIDSFTLQDEKENIDGREYYKYLRNS